jgi:hypothetical protein
MLAAGDHDHVDQAGGHHGEGGWPVVAHHPSDLVAAACAVVQTLLGERDDVSGGHKDDSDGH